MDARHHAPEPACGEVAAPVHSVGFTQGGRRHTHEAVGMLRQMREWFHYLKWLLMIIVFMFILWGVSIGVGGMSNRPTTTDWAAKRRSSGL